LRDGVTSEERERIKALEREVKELRKANEILKLASAFFAQAELDRKLKSWGRSLTGTAIPTGSSRSARSCRSPRRDIGTMPPGSATRLCIARAHNMMARAMYSRYLDFSVIDSTIFG